MGLHGMLIQITLIGVIISAIVVAAAEAALAKPGCHDKCGDVEIPFPFGLKDGCYLDETFHIACDDNVTAKTGSLTVTNISIEVHEMRVLSYVARDCYNMTVYWPGIELPDVLLWLNRSNPSQISTQVEGSYSLGSFACRTITQPHATCLSSSLLISASIAD
uniref:Wall-associated receptor kinase galacturonan-binding domain-containing protein n=1 Tax=Fagus sylvatica TaxID=28930 RepID=A0A2N9FF72_FAGSY